MSIDAIKMQDMSRIADSLEGIDESLKEISLCVRAGAGNPLAK